MTNSKNISTKVIDGKDARLVLDQAEIRVVSGPDRGAKFLLGADSVLIGSSAKCEFVLHDGTVSSRHAEIQVTANGYFIRDLGSTNGILVGAYKVDRLPLADDMRLQLGDSTLTVRSLGKKLSVPLARAGHFGSIVAQSVKMRAFVERIEQAARTDITVLIEGESGSGKELTAQMIHRASDRRAGPLVIFDCSATTASLAAAELFGHEKGAFTGANSARIGLVEEAEGGTLFLDELGELPREMQPLLLGLLERKRTRRIGGGQDIRHDVRIVAATNRNLAEEVRAKTFREDLYHRVSVMRLRVPPLRERPEDIPALASAFAAEVNGHISTEALAPMLSYGWPGNVRELRNVVTRMAVQNASANVAISDGEPQKKKNVSPLFDKQGGLRPWIEVRQIVTSAAEKEYVEAALQIAKNSLTRGAEIAGITRQSFTALAIKHGLHPRDQ